MTAHLGLPYFLFLRGQYFHFILEVLTTEKRAHARPILPFTTEKLALMLPSAHAGPIFIFLWTVLPFYFGSTNHGKTRVAPASAHAGPILPFFYFYFSVDSTSILLFFRSTESHGKTRSVFTPPL